MSSPVAVAMSDSCEKRILMKGLIDSIFHGEQVRRLYVSSYNFTGLARSEELSSLRGLV